MNEELYILGPDIGDRDASGRRKARVGTLYLKSNGLVTSGNMHALQRIAWFNHLDKIRAGKGLPALTEDEKDDEVAHSVDLLFDDHHVLIRPVSTAMERAFEADERLQELVSKRSIRYLNTQCKLVHDALRARGENWRMSRPPTSVQEMEKLIVDSLTALECQPIYFYNKATGTRFLTLGKFTSLGNFSDENFRKQLQEIVRFSAKRNRFGNPEIDVFPQDCTFTRHAFKSLDADNLPLDALRAAYRNLLSEFCRAVPLALQTEGIGNIEWRNQLCSALTLQPNAVEANNLIQGISSVFFMQIKWLPGCYIDKGELIFDPIFDELKDKPDSEELQALCNLRAKAILFNYIRERSTIEYINIGCIEHSLSASRPQDTERYLVQLKEVGKPESELRILRFQKWDVKKHLDEKDDLLTAVMKSMEYTDYVLDRRLGCRQLGMNLPDWLTLGRIEELYAGKNQQYRGSRCWTVYFEREYVTGEATDKIPLSHYADRQFNCSFAQLLGEAAAINCIVGRADEHGKVIFDDGDEVIACDVVGMPERLIVSDHTGAFAQWAVPLTRNAEAYAKPVNWRVPHMCNATEFANIYLSAFQTRFEQVQQEYKKRQRAFERLLEHRLDDPEGSYAHRWKDVLKRLETTDAAELTTLIRSHITFEAPTP